MTDFFGASDPNAVGVGLVFLLGIVPGFLRGYFVLLAGRGTDA